MFTQRQSGLQMAFEAIQDAHGRASCEEYRMRLDGICLSKLRYALPWVASEPWTSFVLDILT